MAIVVFEGTTLEIPEWVTDLTTFRRWGNSDEFPEEGRICFINGEVWADMSYQQVFSHVRVRNAIDYTLTGLVKKAGNGIYFPDGVRFFSENADLSAVPDGSYISYNALRIGRVKLNPGARAGYFGGRRAGSSDRSRQRQLGRQRLRMADASLPGRGRERVLGR